MTSTKLPIASNTAAWLTAAKATPLEVGPAPLGVPEQSQILVKNHAIAINPVNGKMQYLDLFPLNYPTILGEDVAGEVVATGPGVTRFKVGDRVMGFATGMSSKKDTEQAFQAYTVLNSDTACEIPDSMPFHDAVVLPLALSTAASGLFLEQCLNLQLPSEPAGKPSGKVLLVWGGASSVGINAMQLAVAAGYDVIATASEKTFDYVKSFGASRVFDYRSDNILGELLDAVKGKEVVGVFDSVGGDAFAPALEFVQQANGAKSVITAARGFPEPPQSISMKQTQALWIQGTSVGKYIWEEFVPKALKAGTYMPGPTPFIAGTGLESLQSAVDLQRKGVSARKIVVSL